VATRRSTSALETKPRATSAWDVDQRRELRRFLRLDRAVDDGERLPGADPLARLDEDADDLAAFARNAHRHVVAGGELAGGRDGSRDLLAARDDDADRGRGLRALPGLDADCDLGLVAAAASEDEIGGDQQHQHRHDGEDEVPAPTAGGGRLVVDDERVRFEGAAAPFGRLEIHSSHIPHTGQAAGRTSATVLAE